MAALFISNNLHLNNDLATRPALQESRLDGVVGVDEQRILLSWLPALPREVAADAAIVALPFLPRKLELRTSAIVSTSQNCSILATTEYSQSGTVLRSFFTMAASSSVEPILYERRGEIREAGCSFTAACSTV